MVNAFDGLMPTVPVIEPGVGPPPLMPLALARMLVNRKMRLPVVVGGRIGTPKNVTWFPLTTPWNTLGAAVLPPGAVTGTPVAAGAPFCAGTLPTYSTQPLSGFGQTFWAR